MDPRPTNYLRQNIVFSYPEMIRVSFSLFLSFSVFCYFTLLVFIKIILLLFIYFYYFFFPWKLFLFFHVPECSGMFRHVPECSVFRVQFIDDYTKQTFGNRYYTIYVCATTWIFYKTRHWGWFFSLNFDNKKRSKIKHKQDRFFSMKWYKNQVIGMSGHTGQTEKRELAVEAGSLFSTGWPFTCVFLYFMYTDG